MHVTTHLINNRAYTSQIPLEEEYHFERGKNYLFELPYLGSLAIKGEQASAFLQGQLSCDVNQVTPTQFRQAILCSLQGRILALLKVVQWHGLQLILPKDLIESTIKSLSRPAALAKICLEANSSCRVYGLIIDNVNDLQPAGISLPTEALTVTQTDHDLCAHLGLDKEGRALYLLLQRNLSSNPEQQPPSTVEQALGLKDTQPVALKNEWTELFHASNQLRGSLAWHHHLLAQKQIEIYPNTRGFFLPHRLDLDQFGYINFNKGCYKGQEIIARTHYKAKRKHELHCWLVETEASMIAGKNIVDNNGAAVGELVDFSPYGLNRYRVVASMRLTYPDQIQLEDQPHLLQFSNE